MEQLFYLVLYFNSLVVMPDKYTKEQCEAAGKYSYNKEYRCIPAPKCILLTTENHGSYGNVKCAY